MQVFARKLPANELAGLREMFEAIDTDGSGTISVDELREGLRKKGTLLALQVRAGGARLGLRGGTMSGVVRMPHVAWRGPVLSQEVRDIMDNIDVNGNSRIDYEGASLGPPGPVEVPRARLRLAGACAHLGSRHLCPPQSSWPPRCT